MKALVFCVSLLSLSFNANSQLSFAIEAGAANYSLIGLHSKNYNQPQSGMLLKKAESEPFQHLGEALGVSVQYPFSDSFVVDAAWWYLGQPKIKTIYTYQNSGGSYSEATSISDRKLTAQILQLGYKSFCFSRPCELSIGVSRFEAREDYDDANLQIQNQRIYSFNVESRSYKSSVYNAAAGLITHFDQYQLRWQHVHSMYGPVEMFTLGYQF